MSRLVVAVASVILLSITCLAQAAQKPGPQNPARDGGNRASSQRGNQSSQPMTEPSVSVARLRAPRKALDLYEKARAAVRKGKNVEAENILHRALLLYPAFPEALTLSGVIQLDRDDWEAAEQNLQAALRIDSGYGVTYLVLSDLYNREQRFSDALAAAQRADTLTPGSWYVQYEIARALIGIRQYDEALKISDTALRTNRGTLLHMARAHALMGLGRNQEAFAELQTYLYYQPTGEGSQDARNILDKYQTAMSQ